MLSLWSGSSGTSSGVRYSMETILPSPGRGRSALSRLIIKSGCSPKTFLKVKSALGSTYLRSFIRPPSVWRSCGAAFPAVGSRGRSFSRHGRLRNNARSGVRCHCVTAIDAICLVQFHRCSLLAVQGMVNLSPDIILYSMFACQRVRENQKRGAWRFPYSLRQLQNLRENGRDKARPSQNVGFAQ